MIWGSGAKIQNILLSAKNSIEPNQAQSTHKSLYYLFSEGTQRKFRKYIHSDKLKYCSNFTYSAKYIFYGRIFAGCLQVIFCLKIHQRVSRNVESSLEHQGCLGRKRATCVKDFVYNSIFQPHIICQLTLRNATLQYFIFYHLTRVCCICSIS